MEEDSVDDDEFSNVALCICATAENLHATEDELAHVQVSITLKPTCYVSVLMMVIYIVVIL